MDASTFASMPAEVDISPRSPIRIRTSHPLRHLPLGGFQLAGEDLHRGRDLARTGLLGDPTEVLEDPSALSDGFTRLREFPPHREEPAFAMLRERLDEAVSTRTRDHVRAPLQPRIHMDRAGIGGHGYPGEVVPDLSLLAGAFGMEHRPPERRFRVRVVPLEPIDLSERVERSREAKIVVERQEELHGALRLDPEFAGAHRRLVHERQPDPSQSDECEGAVVPHRADDLLRPLEDGARTIESPHLHQRDRLTQQGLAQTRVVFGEEVIGPVEQRRGRALRSSRRPSARLR